MKSPFPGMDPYLQQHWRDVHHSLVTYARDQLQEYLPNDLRARVAERVFLETEEGKGRDLYPDVRVVERARPARQSTATAVALAEPLVIEFASEPISEGYIEIIDASTGNRVVTVIEFVSPTNKTPGEGKKLYLKKQQECLASEASLVEIDLIRGGDWVIAIPKAIIPPAYRTTYRICVRRAWRPLKAEIYRAPLQEPLPAIAVPLRESDRDVPLNLQALIEQCYQKGRYDDLDYRSSLDPPLDNHDAAWADELLRGKGVR